jgi:hypothetical protein
MANLLAAAAAAAGVVVAGVVVVGAAAGATSLAAGATLLDGSPSTATTRMQKALTAVLHLLAPADTLFAPLSLPAV